MNQVQAFSTISKLACLTIPARDRALCAMPRAHWLAIARALKITLPASGGDAPVILNVAIMRQPK